MDGSQVIVQTKKFKTKVFPSEYHIRNKFNTSNATNARQVKIKELRNSDIVHTLAQISTMVSNFE